MPDKPQYSKMEKLNFEAGLSRGLKDVQDGTKIPYPTLININRGYQMIKGKKVKYTAHRGTRMILEDFYGVPWEDIFEDRSGIDLEEKQTPSLKEAVKETFTIEKQ